jgi:uncharacterized coiled-coil DUF342 family protein
MVFIGRTIQPMDNTTLIQASIAAVALLLTNLVSFFVARKKNNNDAFKNLVDANEQFRNEIRNDLIGAKKEAQDYKDLFNELKEKINEYETQIIELKNQILEYKEIRLEYEAEISQLRARLEDDRK